MVNDQINLFSSVLAQFLDLLGDLDLSVKAVYLDRVFDDNNYLRLLQRYYHARRFGIEVSYRLSEQGIGTTTTRNQIVRLSYVVASLLT